MNNEKYLFVVSGPAGVGKDSVVGLLREKHPEVGKTVSATTRAPRQGEIPDVSYHYLAKEAFEKLLADDGLVEYNNYVGNYYGTLRTEIEKPMEESRPVIMVIDVHGAANIKRLYPGSTTVFICPPSREELEKRLRGRGTESEEKIQKRLAESLNELAKAEEYDERIVNDTLEEASERLYRLICGRISE